MPRTQNFFTGFHLRCGKVIDRRLRGPSEGSPRRRMNNFGEPYQSATLRYEKGAKHTSVCALARQNAQSMTQREQAIADNQTVPCDPGLSGANTSLHVCVM